MSAGRKDWIRADEAVRAPMDGSWTNPADPKPLRSPSIDKWACIAFQEIRDEPKIF